MADTILSSALTALIPDKTKTVVFLGGTLAVLASGGTYPGDLKQIALSKISIAIEVEKGKIMGPNAAKTALIPIRSFVKSFTRTVKVDTAELKNATVLALYNSGPMTNAKMKLLAKDLGDTATSATFVLGEFTGTLSLEGGMDLDQGEPAQVSLSIEIDGEVTLAANASVA